MNRVNEMAENKPKAPGRKRTTGAGQAKQIGTPGTPEPVASDDETKGDDDLMRRHQSELPPRKAKAVMQVKDLGQRFVNELRGMTRTSDCLANDREVDVAVERIEEAVMWAVKGITYGER